MDLTAAIKAFMCKYPPKTTLAPVYTKAKQQYDVQDVFRLLDWTLKRELLAASQGSDTAGGGRSSPTKSVTSSLQGATALPSNRALSMVLKVAQKRSHPEPPANPSPPKVAAKRPRPSVQLDSQTDLICFMSAKFARIPAAEHLIVDYAKEIVQCCVDAVKSRQALGEFLTAKVVRTFADYRERRLDGQSPRTPRKLRKEVLLIMAMFMEIVATLDANDRSDVVSQFVVFLQKFNVVCEPGLLSRFFDRHILPAYAGSLLDVIHEVYDHLLWPLPGFLQCENSPVSECSETAYAPGGPHYFAEISASQQAAESADCLAGSQPGRPIRRQNSFYANAHRRIAISRSTAAAARRPTASACTQSAKPSTRVKKKLFDEQTCGRASFGGVVGATPDKLVDMPQLWSELLTQSSVAETPEKASSGKRTPQRLGAGCRLASRPSRGELARESFYEGESSSQTYALRRQKLAERVQSAEAGLKLSTQLLREISNLSCDGYATADSGTWLRSGSSPLKSLRGSTNSVPDSGFGQLLSRSPLAATAADSAAHDVFSPDVISAKSIGMFSPNHSCLQAAIARSPRVAGSASRKQLFADALRVCSPRTPLADPHQQAAVAPVPPVSRPPGAPVFLGFLPGTFLLEP